MTPEEIQRLKQENEQLKKTIEKLIGEVYGLKGELQEKLNRITQLLLETI